MISLPCKGDTFLNARCQLFLRLLQPSPTTFDYSGGYEQKKNFIQEAERVESGREKKELQFNYNTFHIRLEGLVGRSLQLHFDQALLLSQRTVVQSPESESPCFAYL